MNLLRQKSDRCDKDGKAYTDLFLTWRKDEKVYIVRVFPCFSHDYKLLVANAVNVPKDENLEKYL